MPEHAHTNRLANETSPYLLQHAHNPVDWWPWCPEALADARHHDRPILLSVGYSACHWCHVMERESFENTATAQLMNSHFTCVKVDREERPDIDHIYMQAVQAMTGHGGWPMTVFLTPEGAPFYGGTYFPPEDRPGVPGFPRILTSVAQAWASNREQIDDQGTALVEALAAPHPGRSAETLPRDLLEPAIEAMEEQFDHQVGGFGMAPKFPQTPSLDLLLRICATSDDPRSRGMLATALDAMVAGGICDQVGGGFHRYSVDRFWLVPHFEKMLSDNAQLAHLYVRAGRLLGADHYVEAATDTLDYILRDMTDPSGAFYASEDADSEGEEGRFYTWTEAEALAVPGMEGAGALAAFGITSRGNWEGTNVLTHPDPAADAPHRRALRSALCQARNSRIRPGRDDKIITSWNGLALAALADAGAMLGRDDYLQAARSNAAFLVEEMTTDHGDGVVQLHHTARFMRTVNQVHPTSYSNRLVVSGVPGFLEDYGALATGLLRLHAASGETEWLAWAERLMEAVIVRFVGDDGLLYDTDIASDHLVARPRDIQDNACPSGTALACEALLDLAAITGRSDFKAVATTILNALAPVATGYATSFGRLLCAASRLATPGRQLAIVGEPGSPTVDAMLAEAAARYRPDLVVAVASPSSLEAHRWELFEGRLKPASEAIAYLCHGTECLLPTTSPKELRQALDTAPG